MIAITILLGCTTIYCALKWLSKHILALSLVYYLEKKGCTPPTKEEMKECSEFVTTHLIEDVTLFKKGGKR